MTHYLWTVSVKFQSGHSIKISGTAPNGDDAMGAALAVCVHDWSQDLDSLEVCRAVTTGDCGEHTVAHTPGASQPLSPEELSEIRADWAGEYVTGGDTIKALLSHAAAQDERIAELEGEVSFLKPHVKMLARAADVEKENAADFRRQRDEAAKISGQLLDQTRRLGKHGPACYDPKEAHADCRCGRAEAIAKGTALRQAARNYLTNQAEGD